VSIKVTCPHCDKTFGVADQHAGRKIRCKYCDERFLVEDPDDEDIDDEDEEEEEEERPKRRKKRGGRKAAGGGVPMWAFAVGGGVAVVLVVLFVVVVVVNRKKPPAGNIAGGVPNPGGAAIPRGPHLEIMRGYVACISAVSTAVGQVSDGPSAQRAAAEISSQTSTLRSLYRQLENAGPMAPADAGEVRSLYQQGESMGKGLLTNLEQASRRNLPANDASSLRSSLQSFITAVQLFQTRL
jgi:hypothetical protein